VGKQQKPKVIVIKEGLKKQLKNLNQNKLFLESQEKVLYESLIAFYDIPPNSKITLNKDFNIVISPQKVEDGK